MHRFNIFSVLVLMNGKPFPLNGYRLVCVGSTRQTAHLFRKFLITDSIRHRRTGRNTGKCYRITQTTELRPYLPSHQFRHLAATSAVLKIPYQLPYLPFLFGSFVLYRQIIEKEIIGFCHCFK